MILCLLISGDILYCGLFVAAVGVLVDLWLPRLGAGLLWSGLVLAVAAAVPLPTAMYVTLVLCGVAWEVVRRRSRVLRWASTAAVVAAAAAVGAGGLFTRGRLDLALPRDRTVYVLGDSLTSGLAPSQVGTWPQVLSAQRGLSVVSLARPGATLADGGVQADAVPADRPAIVLVELGGNDLPAGVSPARFEADLRSLLAIVVSGPRRVLMFELPLLPFQNQYGRIQREVCRERGVTLIPRWVLSGALALPGHTDDGLHFSARGHAWLAQQLGRMWR